MLKNRPELAMRADEILGWRVFSRWSEGGGAKHPPVVLVHGLSMSSLYMLPTARRLAARHRVYAPDLPGYGRSENVHRPLTVAQLAIVLREWMDRLNIGPAVLVGNSMGCQVIARFAADSPEQALKLVLIGPTIDPSARSYPATIKRGLLQLAFEPLTFYPVVLLDYLSHGLGHTIRSLGNALVDPIERQLPRLGMPVLVVRGAHDFIISQQWVETMTRLLPVGQLEVVPNAGHVTNFDSPDRLEQILTPFIDL